MTIFGSLSLSFPLELLISVELALGEDETCDSEAYESAYEEDMYEGAL